MREKLEEYGLDARALSGVKVAAVGEATAQALVDFGVRPDLVPSGQQSSEGLLADFAPYDDVFDPIDRVLLPRADIATDTLLAGLQELGWQVDDVTAYRTVRAAPPPAETREALKGGGFDAVLFTSSAAPCATSSASPASRTTRRSWPASARRPSATAEELGLRVDVLAAEGRRRLARRGARGVRPRAARRRAAGVAPLPSAAHRRKVARLAAKGAGGVTPSRRARPRRLRRTPALRRLVADVRVRPADLVLPVFVKEGIAEPHPIGSMPGVVQHTRDSLKKAAARGGRRPASAG